MHIEPFGVEIWMNAHENDCAYNLAETCVASLTLGELLQTHGPQRRGAVGTAPAQDDLRRDRGVGPAARRHRGDVPRARPRRRAGGPRNGRGQRARLAGAGGRGRPGREPRPDLPATRLHSREPRGGGRPPAASAGGGLAAGGGGAGAGHRARHESRGADQPEQPDRRADRPHGAGADRGPRPRGGSLRAGGRGLSRHRAGRRCHGSVDRRTLRARHRDVRNVEGVLARRVAPRLDRGAGGGAAGGLPSPRLQHDLRGADRRPSRGPRARIRRSHPRPRPAHHPRQPRAARRLGPVGTGARLGPARGRDDGARDLRPRHAVGDLLPRRCWRRRACSSPRARPWGWRAPSASASAMRPRRCARACRRSRPSSRGGAARPRVSRSSRAAPARRPPSAVRSAPPAPARRRRASGVRQGRTPPPGSGP